MSAAPRPRLDALRVPAPERERIAARFVADAAAVHPTLQPAARTLLERVRGANWTPEWSIAHWIAKGWGAEPETVRRLAVANVQMVAYQRVADDLADGDAGASDLPLCWAMQHLWLRSLAALFADEPARAAVLWRHLDADLARWIAATTASGRGGGAAGDETDGCAARAAPLKTAAAAAALACGRDDAVGPVRAVMDDLAAAIVLQDDAFDWAEDLAAGRRNAFVAHCTQLPQEATPATLLQAAVLRVIYLGDTGAAYFDAMRGRLRRAAHGADALGLPRLADYARWFEDEVDACAQWLSTQAEAGRAEAGRALSALAEQVAAVAMEDRRCTSPGV